MSRFRVTLERHDTATLLVEGATREEAEEWVLLSDLGMLEIEREPWRVAAVEEEAP